MPTDLRSVFCLTSSNIFESDIRRLARLSAEAYRYREPPSFLSIFLTAGDMEETLEGYQLMLLRATLQEGGVVYAVRNKREDNYIATAWWLPPGKELSIKVMIPYLWRFFWNFGLLRLCLLIYASALVTKALKKAKKYFRRPYAHLMNIVVSDEHRREHLARRLMQPILDWADEERVVLVLEADGNKNIRRIYPRFGFESWGRIKVCVFPYQLMVRFPNNSSQL